MVEKHVLYPEKIYLVKEDRIQDGTIATLAALKEDASVYLVPRRGEEGVTFNISEAGIDIRERAANGSLVHLDKKRTEFGMTFTINMGRWDFNIEALLRGAHPDIVEEDHVASIETADDATVKGLAFLQSINTEKFTALFECAEEPSTGKRLYYYVPKITREFGDREHVLNVQQISSPLPFRALALDDDLSPDPVTAHQEIYNKVTHTDLFFPFYGSIDGSA